MVSSNPEDELLESQITSDMKGKIIIGGSFVGIKAYKKAMKHDVAGIVVGGFNYYDLKEIYGEAPDVVLSCREYLKRHYKVIEKHLEKNTSLRSDGFGLADILLMSCLDWAIFYEFDLSKNITIYKDNISKRESYKKAMEINYGGY